MAPQERKIVKQFDKNGDGWLNLEERTAARDFLKQQPPPPRRGPGPRGGNREPAKPGLQVAPADVKNHPDAPLYDSTVLRTLFFEFENKDWETELSDFYNTDVEVPATLTVDGKKVPNVGVHFRGASSYFMIPAGYKRSFGVSVDFADKKQALYGYRTLNLLNSSGDPTFMSTVVYSHLARPRLPAPKANFVKVVINGESWGIYVNVQQFNKDFLNENYKTTQGARWKVKGRPNGASGLDYVGDRIDAYKQRYELKAGEEPKAWNDLMALCKTLSETPLDKLEEALAPILDIDGALWFLALDIASVNSDGYWIRASDYNLFQDAAGKFHTIPHDMNEAFRPAQGPGRPGGGPGPGGGQELDPLVGMNDLKKPLRSRLLAVPKLKARYLDHLRAIAKDQLDWKKLGLVVDQFRALIEKEVQADTRKLSSFESFKSDAFRSFVEKRAAYLLNHPEIKGEY